MINIKVFTPLDSMGMLKKPMKREKLSKTVSTSSTRQMIPNRSTNTMRRKPMRLKCSIRVLYMPTLWTNEGSMFIIIPRGRDPRWQNPKIFSIQKKRYLLSPILRCLTKSMEPYRDRLRIKENRSRKLLRQTPYNNNAVITNTDAGGRHHSESGWC